MSDQLDLVRRFYAGCNRADVDLLTSLYHPNCVVEHVFVDDDGVFEGRDEVTARWTDEFGRYAGAFAGGHRIAVSRIGGLETGWGWVRSEWLTAIRPADGGEEWYAAGHSHFWIEDDLIRRHRTVRRAVSREDALAPGESVEAGGSRHYPTRPIVGVGGVILTGNGQVVLVKRRYEPLAGQWSLPGGTLETGETLEAGTAREIVEETGLIVDVGEVVDVFDRILVDEHGKVRYHFVLVDYLCRPRGGSLRAGSDVSDAVLADPADLGAYRLTEKALDVVRRAMRLAADSP